MREIKTLVYFDLEATGLKNSGKPRITELSLVAVNRQDVLDLHGRIRDHLSNCNNEVETLVPRVLNKITLCVYPMAVIMPHVSIITGLDNYNLTGQAIFDKNTGDLLKNFLVRLPSPICLVAHNGSLYDFPLLKAEMKKTGTALGSQILCADSYVGIREIFKKRKDRNGCKENKLINKNIVTVTELLTSGQHLVKPSSTIDQLSCIVAINSRKAITCSKASTPTSFSLINLHQYFMGCPPSQSHGAEADCLALLRTTAVLGEEWLDWVENNCYLFSDCVGMWGIIGQGK
jgi:DNA polymerase III epsilon subunit-like protein